MASNAKIKRLAQDQFSLSCREYAIYGSVVYIRKMYRGQYNSTNWSMTDSVKLPRDEASADWKKHVAEGWVEIPV